MPTIKIEYTENDLKNLILQDLERKMPGSKFALHDLSIKVKSAQNYKAEWETANFKCEVSKFN